MAGTFSHCMQAVKMNDARSQSMLHGQEHTSIWIIATQSGCHCQMRRCSAPGTQQAVATLTPKLPTALMPA